MNAQQRADVRESIAGLNSVALALERAGMPAGATANRVLATQTVATLDALERVLALHADNGAGRCKTCRTASRPGSFTMDAAAWPCATVRAIEAPE